MLFWNWATSAIPAERLYCPREPLGVAQGLARTCPEMGHAGVHKNRAGVTWRRHVLNLERMRQSSRSCSLGRAAACHSVPHVPLPLHAPTCGAAAEVVFKPRSIGGSGLRAQRAAEGDMKLREVRFVLVELREVCALCTNVPEP